MSAPEELRQAAASGDRSEVERLLETYAVPLQESNRWSSALFSACNAGHTDLVRLLLRRTKPTDELLASLAAQALVTKQERLALEIVGAGALPDEALREAAELDLDATVTELLASGRASEDGVREAVFAAAREGKREALVALLASEHAAAALATSDDEGFGALAQAVANGHDAAAALLEARGASKRGLALGAAQRGDEALLERALAAGEDVKRVTDGGFSALHFAASGGHTALVLRLLALGADLEAETRDGRTPASVAAHEGHLDVVVALEQHGAALGRALVEAASGGRLPIVELCLAKGVPVEIADEYSETALHKAAQRGDVAVLRAVLGKKPKIDRGNINGWTALMRASGGGHVEAVRALIEHGAAVNHATEYGYETALSWAAKNGHLDVVDRLLRSGAAILRKGYNRPLFLAAEAGHTAVALRLCAAGAAVDEEDDGKTPLALAARGGHTTTVTALLDQGARPSAGAMLAAAEAGHAAVVELLRARGAPLPEGFLAKAAEGGQAGLVKLALAAHLPIEERSGYWARTPLMLAAERGARDVVQLLLDAGAEPNVRDSELKSCVRLAQDRGHDAVVALLVARGARAELAELGELAATGSLSELTLLLGRGAHPDVRLHLERTPLHEAAALGRLEAVRALCDAGASVDLVDADGWTALMEACDFGQLEVARALCDAKADPFVQDRAGFTAFKLAERAGHAPLVALFEERELDRDWRPDLFAAARTGDVATLERMAAKGRPLDLTEHGATIVHLAAESGQLEALRFALEHGVAVDREDRQGATPLYLAAGAGHAAAVEHLLVRGARYDVRDRYGEPAIVGAAARGDVDVLRLLLGAGADREATDSEGKTAFAKALEHDRTAVALLLLASGAQAPESAMHEVLDKDVALVKALLARGEKLPSGDSRARALAIELWQSGEPAELDHPDQALVEAVESDEPAVVLSLLERGTDPNARDASGRTVLLLAKKRGDKTIEKLLRKHGGRPLGMLCAAAGEGTALTAKALKAALADGDTLDATDGEGNTALHLYAQAGDAKSSKALIDAGAPLDARNKEDATPLLLALQKDHYDLAARLEAAGADVAAGDPAEWSAAAHYLGHGLLDRAKAAVAKGASPEWLVHAAAGSGDLVRVALAIELGGRADVVTKTGWTAARSAASSGKREVLDEVLRLGSPKAFALHGAVSSGNAELVRYVLDGAPDVNAKDGWARTALHEAMFGGVEIATLLLDAGADPNVPDDDGSTAIFYAVSQENAELLRLLVSRGAQVSHENARGQTVSDLARWSNAEVKNALGIAEPKGRWGSSDD